MGEFKESRKVRYTKTALRDSLMELMTDKPISKITVKEICERADINRTTFYSYYTDQYNLLSSVEKESLEKLKETVLAIGNRKDSDKTLFAVEEIFQYIAESNTAIRVLLSERGDIKFQKKIFDVIINFMSDSFGHESSNNDTFLYYYTFIVTGCIGMVQRWLESGMDKSPKEMAEVVLNAVAKLI